MAVVTRDGPPLLHLFADFTACVIARRQGSGFETLTFARAHAFAGVIGSLAIVLAFATVNAVAMYLRFFGHYLGRQTGEQTGSSQSQSSASDVYGFLNGHKISSTYIWGESSMAKCAGLTP
jgi:hypothetical protein